MKYWVKRIKTVRRTLAVLFCTAFLLSGLNIFCVDLSRGPSQPQKAAKAKSIGEIPGMLGEEAGGELLTVAAAGASFGVSSLKYLFVRTDLFLVPLILWAVLTVLLQEGYTGRIFLIRFIHNSDGKKERMADF
ncbi:MAG: hypothetical protein QM683_05065 [Lacrimispora sp.]